MLCHCFVRIITSLFIITKIICQNYYVVSLLKRKKFESIIAFHNLHNQYLLRLQNFLSKASLKVQSYERGNLLTLGDIDFVKLWHAIIDSNLFFYVEILYNSFVIYILWQTILYFVLLMDLNTSYVWFQLWNSSRLDFFIHNAWTRDLACGCWVSYYST